MERIRIVLLEHKLLRHIIDRLVGHRVQQATSLVGNRPLGPSVNGIVLSNTPAFNRSTPLIVVSCESVTPAGLSMIRSRTTVGMRVLVSWCSVPLKA